MSDDRIIFCVNDAIESQLAAQEVASRRWPKGSQVRFLTVVNPNDYSLVPLLDQRIAQVRQLHQHLINELAETPVICTSVIREGDPLTSILAEAREWQPTRIFIGTRGRNRLTRLFRPRLAAAVQARLECPVEVIGHKHTVRDSFNRLAVATSRYRR